MGSLGPMRETDSESERRGVRVGHGVADDLCNWQQQTRARGLLSWLRLILFTSYYWLWLIPWPAACRNWFPKHLACNLSRSKTQCQARNRGWINSSYQSAWLRITSANPKPIKTYYIRWYNWYNSDIRCILKQINTLLYHYYMYYVFYYFYYYTITADYYFF